MNNKNLLLLLFSLFVLLGSYNYYIHNRSNTKSNKEMENNKLLKFNPKYAKKIKIEFLKNDKIISFYRKKGMWVMSKPIESEVKTRNINSLLSIFKLGYIDIIDKDDINYKQYGLDNPILKIILTIVKNNKKMNKVLAIGDNSPTSTSCYCKIDSIDKVYLIGILYKNELMRNYDYYIK